MSKVNLALETLIISRSQTGKDLLWASNALYNLLLSMSSVEKALFVELKEGI